ncbi:cation-translocating P-type ATPase, partial [Candidatus Woesearchaeota archaeon]|nr:cation-translocating P-type ATPase [Candidatus Woesearchaeota archaeon]
MRRVNKNLLKKKGVITKMEKTTLKISGMHCASCATILTKALSKAPGVKSANVNYSTEKATVEFDSLQTNEQELIAAIKNKGYAGHVFKERDAKSELQHCHEVIKAIKNKFWLSTIFAVPALLLSMVFT